MGGGFGELEVFDAGEQSSRHSSGPSKILGSRFAAAKPITATGYGYVRDDGIAVIPIGTLSA